MIAGLTINTSLSDHAADDVHYPRITRSIGETGIGVELCSITRPLLNCCRAVRLNTCCSVIASWLRDQVR